MYDKCTLLSLNNAPTVVVAGFSFMNPRMSLLLFY